MDRELPNEIITRNKRQKAIKWTVIGASILIVLLGVNFLLTGSVKKSRIIIAMVTRGSISSTINASGLVLPEIENVLTSPTRAKVEKILSFAGSKVKINDTILILNREAIESEFQQMSDELEMNMVQLDRQELSFEKSIEALTTEISIRELKIKSLEASYLNLKKLVDIGGCTREELEKAALDLQISRLEFNQMKKDRANLNKTRKVELREKQLMIEIQRKKLEETHKKLAESVVKSTHEGVVTWVYEQTGSEVNPGQEVARIADLSRFKIEGSISDIYADQIRVGQDVLIKISEDKIRGIISMIQPSVKNGIVKFSVTLGEENNNLLRPNMKLDIYPVAGYRSNTLIVKNEGFFTGKESQYAFVVRNGKAFRVKIKTGLSNFDQVEILEGVSENDELIVTDMSEYEHREKLNIRN